MSKETLLETDWLIKEVGEAAALFVQNDLYRWLFGAGARRKSLSPRIAPSIIARSECELFAISAPRFAMRITYPNGSFANLRRLPFLMAAAHKWIEPPPQLDKQIQFDPERYTESPQRVLSKTLNRPIADGLFVPTYRHRDYYVTTTRLACAYGEELDREKEIAGVPYVQHIHLGGGLCAQAVCFAATALLHEFASGVYGVSEITALAQFDTVEQGGVLCLGGLGASSMRRYFQKVNLEFDVLYFMRQWRHRNKRVPPKWLPEMMFQIALRSYVLSQLPVISIVDAGRLAHVYKNIPDLNLPVSKTKEFKVRTHAVLLVGCDKNPRSGAFLMNDPSHLPLVPVSARQLFDARPFTSVKGGDKPVQEVAPKFAVVAPKNVKMPLLTALVLPPSEHDGTCGLFFLSEMLAYEAEKSNLPQDLRDAIVLGDDSKLDCFNPGEAVLLPRDPIAARPIMERILYRDDGRADSIAAAAVERYRATIPLPEWQWLQLRKCPHLSQSQFLLSAFLWDATKRPSLASSNFDRLVLMLDGIIACDHDGNWNFTWSPNKAALAKDVHVSESDDSGVANGRATNDVRKPSCVARIQPSLISSFCERQLTSVLGAAYHNWPDELPRNLDYYAMMQSEVRDEDSAITSAVEYMAHRSADEPFISQLAEDMIGLFRDKSFSMPALASFVPTLTFDCNDSRAATGRNALIFLWKLGTEVRRCQAAGGELDLLKVIEIVCGSRTVGLWPAIDNEVKHEYGQLASSEVYAATMISDADAQKNIVDNLAMIADAIGAPCSYETCPTLSLELEPGGPIFALRNWATLKSLVTRVRANPKLRELVGVNLDIAHFRLAGVSPSELISDSDVFESITHAHISGHHPRAHFGDVLPLLLNAPEDYRAWIELLKVRLISESAPKYSGYVSLELEVIKDDSWVTMGMNQLAKLLS